MRRSQKTPLWKPSCSARRVSAYPCRGGSRRDCLSRIVTAEPGRGRAGSPFGAILGEINLLVAYAHIR